MAKHNNVGRRQRLRCNIMNTGTGEFCANKKTHTVTFDNRFGLMDTMECCEDCVSTVKSNITNYLDGRVRVVYRG